MPRFTVYLADENAEEYDDRKASFVIHDNGVLEVHMGRHTTYHSPAGWLHVVAP
jgi:hypothetical protein